MTIRSWVQFLGATSLKTEIRLCMSSFSRPCMLWSHAHFGQTYFLDCLFCIWLHLDLFFLNKKIKFCTICFQFCLFLTHKAFVTLQCFFGFGFSHVRFTVLKLSLFKKHKWNTIKQKASCIMLLFSLSFSVFMYLMRFLIVGPHTSAASHTQYYCLVM